ncbi:LOW QUALITY PROTEIN: uncharacterized protein [Excalfactoria chinensis]|uniref:LOW QUALITY PROTEIN: uncharacterized protein n=1 Tax=Excalfactoria chinensis TaxID=46218 RepID=UPI003B3ADDAE
MQKKKDPPPGSTASARPAGACELSGNDLSELHRGAAAGDLAQVRRGLEEDDIDERDKAQRLSKDLTKYEDHDSTGEACAGATGGIPVPMTGFALGAPALSREGMQRSPEQTLRTGGESREAMDDISQGDSTRSSEKEGSNDSWHTSEEEELDFTAKKPQKRKLRMLMNVLQKFRNVGGGDYSRIENLKSQKKRLKQKEPTGANLKRGECRELLKQDVSDSSSLEEEEEVEEDEETQSNDIMEEEQRGKIELKEEVDQKLGYLSNAENEGDAQCGAGSVSSDSQKILKKTEEKIEESVDTPVSFIDVRYERLHDESCNKKSMIRKIFNRNQRPSSIMNDEDAEEGQRKEIRIKFQVALKQKSVNLGLDRCEENQRAAFSSSTKKESPKWNEEEEQEKEVTGRKLQTAVLGGECSESIIHVSSSVEKEMVKDASANYGRQAIMEEYKLGILFVLGIRDWDKYVLETTNLIENTAHEKQTDKAEISHQEALAENEESHSADKQLNLKPWEERYERMWVEEEKRELKTNFKSVMAELKQLFGEINESEETTSVVAEVSGDDFKEELKSFCVSSSVTESSNKSESKSEFGDVKLNVDLKEPNTEIVVTSLGVLPDHKNLSANVEITERKPDEEGCTNYTDNSQAHLATAVETEENENGISRNVEVSPEYSLRHCLKTNSLDDISNILPQIRPISTNDESTLGSVSKKKTGKDICLSDSVSRDCLIKYEEIGETGIENLFPHAQQPCGMLERNLDEELKQDVERFKSKVGMLQMVFLALEKEKVEQEKRKQKHFKMQAVEKQEGLDKSDTPAGNITDQPVKEKLALRKNEKMIEEKHTKNSSSEERPKLLEMPKPQKRKLRMLMNVLQKFRNVGGGDCSRIENPKSQKKSLKQKEPTGANLNRGECRDLLKQDVYDSSKLAEEEVVEEDEETQSNDIMEEKQRGKIELKEEVDQKLGYLSNAENEGDAQCGAGSVSSDSQKILKKTEEKIEESADTPVSFIDGRECSESIIHVSSSVEKEMVKDACANYGRQDKYVLETTNLIENTAHEKQTDKAEISHQEALAENEESHSADKQLNLKPWEERYERMWVEEEKRELKTNFKSVMAELKQLFGEINESEETTSVVAEVSGDDFKEELKSFCVSSCVTESSNKLESKSEFGDVKLNVDLKEPNTEIVVPSLGVLPDHKNLSANVEITQRKPDEEGCTNYTDNSEVHLAKAEETEENENGISRNVEVSPEYSLRHCLKTNSLDDISNILPQIRPISTNDESTLGSVSKKKTGKDICLSDSVSRDCLIKNEEIGETGIENLFPHAQQPCGMLERNLDEELKQDVERFKSKEGMLQMVFLALEKEKVQLQKEVEQEKRNQKHFKMQAVEKQEGLDKSDTPAGNITHQPVKEKLALRKNEKMIEEKHTKNSSSEERPKLLEMPVKGKSVLNAKDWKKNENKRQSSKQKANWKIRVMDDSTSSEASQDEKRPTTKTGRKKNKVSMQMDVTDDTDSTRSSDTTTEDAELLTSTYKEAMLLLEQLSVDCTDPAILLKIQNILLEYEQRIDYERSRNTALWREVRKLESEKEESRLVAEQSEDLKSILSQQEMELKNDIQSLEFSLKREEEKRRRAETQYEKTREQLKRKEDQYARETEEKQQLELRARNLETELITLRQLKKQVEEERDEAQRQLSQEKSARALQEGILSNHLLRLKELEEETRKTMRNNSELSSSVPN